ncbi:hypothetical protein LCGC14_2925100, partial [marine sediment metagenome]
DPTSTSIVETVEAKRGRSHILEVRLQDQRHPFVIPTHLRIQGPRTLTVMMLVNGESFFARAWSLMDLDESWIPMLSTPDRPRPIWPVWGGQPRIEFDFHGTETGMVRAAIALEHSDPPPIPMHRNRRLQR